MDLPLLCCKRGLAIQEHPSLTKSSHTCISLPSSVKRAGRLQQSLFAVPWGERGGGGRGRELPYIEVCVEAAHNIVRNGILSTVRCGRC
jgi:hypothetical protein